MIVKCVLAFPTGSARAMAARYEADVVWPEGVRAIGPMYFRFLNEGLRELTIFEIDEDRASEALSAIREYPKRYMGVRGFTYIVDVGLDSNEFMALIGQDGRMEKPAPGEDGAVVKMALSFPTESAAEIGRRLVDGGFDWPDYIQASEPYFFVFMHEGFRSFTVFHIERDRLTDALEEIRSFVKRFFDVQGFTYIVEVAASREEMRNIPE